MLVREAHVELESAVIEIVKRHGLTYAELNGILLECAQGWNKYAIREERHPGDPDQPGDTQ